MLMRCRAIGTFISGGISLLVGMKNCISILEDNLAVSYNTKSSLFLWSSTSVLWYLTVWVENKTMNIYSTFLLNCPKLEAIKKILISKLINRLMDKVWYIHTIAHNLMIKINGLPSEAKRRMKCWQRQKHRDSKQVSSCQEYGGEERVV